VPDLRAGPETHLAVAVNLGLVDDALYHVWSSGLICITPDILDLFNIDLDLTMVGDLLPGFPEGTVFRLMAYLSTPPTMSVAAGPGATMTMGMNGFVADLDALLPDGNTRSLHVELDASATMSVGLDPYANALTMSLVEVSIDRLSITEESSADLLGFDFSRMKQLLEEHVLPHVAEEMTAIPLTGPIFGGLMGYYVVLKEIRATGAFLVAKLDLFRAPETDLNAPDTRIEEAPDGVVAAKDAFIVVAGEDQEVPPELLQFEVVANNRLYEPTFVRRIPVGKAGESGSYEVEVRAVDLNGNMDPTPARVEVTVDGVLPHVGITSAPGGSTESKRPTIIWEMSDDMTSESRLRPVVSLYRMPGSGDPDETIELSPGQTSAAVDLGSGSWRVAVTVYDEAGNEASDSQIFDAGKGGCGCQTARRLPSNQAWALVLLGLGLAAIRIRRRVI
jgi:MYXO-CTERM domain-containing protein